MTWMKHRGEGEKPTEGVKLSGSRMSRTLCGHNSGESLKGAEGARNR